MTGWPRADARMREYEVLPLLAGCSRAQLRQISSAATPLALDAGTVLVRQGARGRQFVIVRGGTAAVWRDGRPVDEIGPGGWFGEVALIRRMREPVSIVARTAMTVDVIARRDPVANREFATLYADIAPLRRCIDVELDGRLARWAPASPALDHIALTVPNLDDQVELLTTSFGMVKLLGSEHFALVVDPASDFKLELSTSNDGAVHLRHLGFRAHDVDATHASLVADGMETSSPPCRQEVARMYSSLLQQSGGVEVQLVKYD